MLSIPLMGAVFRHMEQVTRNIEDRMVAMKPQMQHHLDAFRSNTRSQASGQ
jgi:hypothetical protein